MTTTLDNTLHASRREFAGVRIYAARDGNRVTGRVEFPYETNGRHEIPIDYQNRRPESSPLDKGGPRGVEPSPLTKGGQRGVEPSPLTKGGQRGVAPRGRAAERFKLATRYLDLCREQPGTSKRIHAETIACLGDCSSRSVQLWAQKLKIEGPESLEDHYTPAIPKVPSFDAKHAGDAVLVCAWWAYRIGEFEVIDTKAVATAVALIARGYTVADLIATIDRYYSYECDRVKYPFKPFARWAKYDLAKWMIRAAVDADYARAQSANRQSTIGNRQSTSPDPRTRAMDVNNRPTRAAIRNLAGAHRDRGAASPPLARGDIGGSPRDTLSRATTLAAMGAVETARHEIAKTAPGITPLAAVEQPATMAEALGKMDDTYRRMLLRAAGRPHALDTRRAIGEATATMPLWWDQVPEGVRREIEGRLKLWCNDHRIDPAHPHLPRRRVRMLIPYLRPDKSGVQSLAAALRLPV